MDEYISRETAIFEIKNKCDNMMKFIDNVMEKTGADISDTKDTFRIAYESDINTIKSIPSADVIPVRHGYWIKDKPYRDEEGYIIQQFYCSECGRYEEEQEPYCNCGCKMD